ncbi:MAG: respiratory nitrate reductase subunit gamma [Bacillota bacterium]
MNLWYQFWWVILPYTAITIFVVGHIYRYNTDQPGWTTKSSQLLEKKKLRFGSIFFHLGLLLALGGHLGGLLIPKSWTDAAGISEQLYHQVALMMGGLAGLMALAGVLLLVARRFGDKRIRQNSSLSDQLIALLLLLQILIGVFNTLGFNFLIGGFNYRENLSIWLRELFIFSPNPQLMAEVPLTFQLHVLVGLLIFALWSFTRLVHMWSAPLEYLKRNNILYRRLS